MSRLLYRSNLKKLIEENIIELEKDVKFLEQLEERIENNHIREFMKGTVREKYSEHSVK